MIGLLSKAVHDRSGREQQPGLDHMNTAASHAEDPSTKESLCTAAETEPAIGSTAAPPDSLPAVLHRLQGALEDARPLLEAVLDDRPFIVRPAEIFNIQACLTSVISRFPQVSSLLQAAASSLDKRQTEASTSHSNILPTPGTATPVHAPTSAPPASLWGSGHVASDPSRGAHRAFDYLCEEGSSQELLVLLSQLPPELVIKIATAANLQHDVLQ
ncbi:hypothetical protein WJX84_000768 [Apatococcus fuscideae]|uniref:Uncharacterized protein n=1 Tax=Apatococcus fuscideae TaxID=2026836 RepID=A0AAW1T4W6_9CHLO